VRREHADLTTTEANKIPREHGMHGEQVLAGRVRRGDIIRIRHTHEPGPPCLVSGAVIDALVTSVDRERLGRVALDWQEGPTRDGRRPAVRGCSVYGHSATVTRVGHLEAAA